MTAEESVRVRLTGAQLEYLMHATFLPPSLSQWLAETTARRERPHELTVARYLAEELRAAFTERLAAAGFDADYQPNDEGRMLEDLIDQFLAR